MTDFKQEYMDEMGIGDMPVLLGSEYASDENKLYFPNGYVAWLEKRLQLTIKTVEE